MRNVPVTLINAVDTSTQTGAPIFAGQYVQGSFTSIFGDVTAAGTVTIQGSNAIPVGAPDKFVPPNNTFSVITGASATIASGVGPAIVLPTMNFQYIRAVFAYSSGGSSTVLVNATLLNVS
jgi:hypothetical protein